MPVMLAVFVPQLLGAIVGAAVKVGAGFILTVETAVFLQPFPKVPVTVYDVVLLGETLIDGTLFCPVLQLYVVAPVPVKVAGVPEQTVGEFTPTVGEALIVTVVVAVFTQPLAAVPVIV